MWFLRHNHPSFHTQLLSHSPVCVPFFPALCFCLSVFTACQLCFCPPSHLYCNAGQLLGNCNLGLQQSSSHLGAILPNTHTHARTYTHTARPPADSGAVSASLRYLQWPAAVPTWGNKRTRRMRQDLFWLYTHRYTSTHTHTHVRTVRVMSLAAIMARLRKQRMLFCSPPKIWLQNHKRGIILKLRCSCLI